VTLPGALYSLADDRFYPGGAVGRCAAGVFHLLVRWHYLPMAEEDLGLHLYRPWMNQAAAGCIRTPAMAMGRILDHFDLEPTKGRYIFPGAPGRFRPAGPHYLLCLHGLAIHPCASAAVKLRCRTDWWRLIYFPR
jgi:hypothetical protein